MTSPLVSICCLAYNHEPYIRQCIEGFLMQKTTFSFEVLIHDDASTDKTAEIIREYELMYPGIIKPIYQIENQHSKGIKVSATYNFPRAIGKYIAMCEGDDYWIDPLKLQKQINFLEANSNYSMCFHNSLIYNHEKLRDSHLFNTYRLPQNVSYKEVIDSWIVPTASMMFIKECVNNLPSWAKSPKVLSGDLVLILLSIKHGQIGYIDEIMSVYRRNFDGTSATAQYKKKFDLLTKQQIYLFESFSKEVSGDNLIYVQNKISKLKRDLKFYNYSQKNLIWAFIRMPNFFINKLLNKVSSKI